MSMSRVVFYLVIGLICTEWYFRHIETCRFSSFIIAWHTEILVHLLNGLSGIGYSILKCVGRCSRVFGYDLYSLNLIDVKQQNQGM